MSKNVLPVLEESMLKKLEAIKARPDVAQALALCQAQEAMAIKEQIHLTQIPAPTFEESQRAQELARLMREYGLEDVVIDPSGNVVGRRAGTQNGPVLAIAAHTDTVFARNVDVTVRQEGNLYYGCGMGDNSSGQRAMLQMIRALNAAGIRTKGDILFVGTVGEEGNGDIRGAKALFDGSRKIDAFIALDMCDVYTIQNGATGAHRWRLSIDGQGGHSYLDYGRTPSAIHAICRAGAKIADLDLPQDPRTTYTIGTIKGGTTVNTIAAHCEVDVDMRSVDMAELEKLEKQILEAFEAAVREENAHWKKADAEHQLTLTKTQIGNRPAGMRPDNCPAIQSVLAAMKVLDIELKVCEPSSTDANMPMSMGIPSVCIGTGGKTRFEHSLKEVFEADRIWLGPQLALLASLSLVGLAD